MARSVSDLDVNVDPALLREVAAGSTIEVTKDGAVVALLVPAPTRTDVRQRAATVRGGFATLPRVDLEQPVQAVLDDLRSNR